MLVSTDPASNVGQVFETNIGNKITAISNVSGLDAIEINPEEAAAVYRLRKRDFIELSYTSVLTGRNTVLETEWKLGFWTKF